MTSSWMLVSGFFFAASGVFIKLGAQWFDAAEMAFYRSIFTFLAIAGVVAVRGGGSLWPGPALGTHVIRGTMGAISLVGYFHAITQLPLATAQTLNYTSPLFLAIATTLVMGERFSKLLIAAVLLGFAGIAILLQPSFARGQEAPALIGLFSGAFASWAYLAVRSLGRSGEPDWRIVLWFGLVASVLTAGWQLATSTFHPLRWENAWLVVAVGITGTLAQLAMTRAYSAGNTLVSGALSYSTIVYATVFTVVIWDEKLSPLAWIGMVVIVASGLLALRAEKRELQKEAGFES
jgi:drug/metabolite transporter (DMT)-like permease